MGNKIFFNFCRKEKSKSIKAKSYSLLKYCCEKALYVETYNMVNSGYEKELSKEDRKKAILQYNKEFVRLQNLNGHCQYDKRKTYHYIISPEEPNVSPTILLNMARDYLQKNYPNGQAVLSIHNDNGRYHCHIALNSVLTNLQKIQYSLSDTKDTREIKNKKNGKVYTCEIKHNTPSYKAQVKYVEEELAKKYNFEITTETQRKKKIKKIKNDKIDYAFDKYKKTPTDKNYIQEQIYSIVKNGYTDTNDFISQAKNKNIEITIFEDKEKHKQYRYKYQNHSFSANSLGTFFNYDTINNSINKVNEKENKQVMEQPTQEKSNNMQDQNYLDYISQLASDYDADKELDKQIAKLEKDITTSLKDNGLWNKDNEEILKNVLHPKDKNTPKKVVIENLNKLSVSITKQIANIALDYTKETMRQGLHSNDYGGR